MPRATAFEVAENATELKNLMNAEKNAQRRTKIQVLYLLKSSNRPNISNIALIVGRNRGTIHRWLKKYQREGLYNLLDNSGHKRSGRKRSIPDSIALQIKDNIQCFNDYKDIQIWLHEEHSLEVSYDVVRELLCYRLKLKLNKTASR